MKLSLSVPTEFDKCVYLAIRRKYLVYPFLFYMNGLCQMLSVS